jgi:hypothetical protein
MRYYLIYRSDNIPSPTADTAPSDFYEVQCATILLDQLLSKENNSKQALAPDNKPLTSVECIILLRPAFVSLHWDTALSETDMVDMRPEFTSFISRYFQRVFAR